MRPTPKALAWLVGYLSDIGVTPTPTPSPPQSREEELVERYRHYLVVERGLAPETVVEYVRAAVLFLVEHPGCELDDVGIGDVSRFMTRHCRLVSPKSVERLATGLRSFLGFALLEGAIVVPLAGAVPSAALERRRAASGSGSRTSSGAVGQLRSAPRDRQARLRHLGAARPPRVASRRSRGPPPR